MPVENAVTAQGLAKKFRLFRTQVDRMKEAFSFGRTCLHHELWGLAEIDFALPKGAALGIIGANGSGKSTLLQLVAGVLRPTSGRVTVDGRVAALLELGSAFNPEFTGRQNVLFFGSMFGMGESDMAERLPRIEAVANIGDFIDQPVRTYSSGMLVKLAFTTAISINPEVLIIDEALGVGDVRFQQRAWREIERLRAAGTTLLLVSHSLDTIQRACDTVLLLDRGRIIEIGDPARVIAAYHRRMTRGSRPDTSNKIRQQALDELANRPIGDGMSLAVATVLYGMVIAANEVDPPSIPLNAEFELMVRVRLSDSRICPVLSVAVHTVEGILMFTADSRRAHDRVETVAAERGLIYRMRLRARMKPGDYFIDVMVAVERDGALHAVEDCRNLVRVTIIGTPPFDGLADLEPCFE